MYNLLANESAASLRAFFQTTLPSLAEDWWQRHVVNALTFQQQRRVEESRIESLAGLDLVASISKSCLSASLETEEGAEESENCLMNIPLFYVSFREWSK